jgi:hypothetical protein
MKHDDEWPAIPLSEWRDTCDALHLYTQIVGKIRLRSSPWQNHYWHCTLFLTARGLATPTLEHGNRCFQIEFDFISNRLRIHASAGDSGGFTLEPQSVARFYERVMAELDRLGLSVAIDRKPNEVADAIPFHLDTEGRPWDAGRAAAYWRALLQAERIFRCFRADFLGKCSPVHYFWGAPDLAVTRFSGRRAPPHPGGVPNLPDRVTRESYSHEVASCGFWPGGDPYPEPAFYAYAYPEPAAYAQARVSPAAAFYSEQLREFILPYEAVRRARSPEKVLLEFLRTSYGAAADLGQWNRAELEYAAGA